VKLTPIPRAIQTPWEDLLTKRALLHAAVLGLTQGRPPYFIQYTASASIAVSAGARPSAAR
jgi:hypothetical protein